MACALTAPPPGCSYNFLLKSWHGEASVSARHAVIIPHCLTFATIKLESVTFIMCLLEQTTGPLLGEHFPRRAVTGAPSSGAASGDRRTFKRPSGDFDQRFEGDLIRPNKYIRTSSSYSLSSSALTVDGQ
ncbi:Hypothetical predicted protein, partial [Scomber scombrus]